LLCPSIEEEQHLVTKVYGSRYKVASTQLQKSSLMEVWLSELPQLLGLEASHGKTQSQSEQKAKGWVGFFVIWILIVGREVSGFYLPIFKIPINSRPS
jgi:hypothetical protein